MATATATATMHGLSGCGSDVRTQLESFSPSMWGEIFSTFSLDDQVQQTYAEAIEALKQEARSMLKSATSGKLIMLIDTLERLGLGYHFETEIGEKLEEIYSSYLNLGDEDEDYDLFTAALQFRLLRQHQYHVSCKIFDKFTDKNKKLKEILSNDVEGLLNLYEAAHVRIHGEDILEEALAFTAHHLTHVAPRLGSPLKDKVKRALEQSLHRGISIIHAREYISAYENNESRDVLLLKLAKLNFNFLQNLYKKELCELYRWWNKFDLKSKLTHTRDRLTESYIWALALHFEPQYSYVRLAVAKIVQMATIMDDTYDNYATLEEAQLFTDILGRSNLDEIDRLPYGMKVVYQFITSIFEDYEREAAEQEKSFAVPYFREAVIQLGRAYNQELKWLMERHIPSFEDYFANSVITSCVYVMFTALFPGVKSVNKGTIDWLLSEPKIVLSTAKIGRLLNDLVSHERETRGGKMITLVDCRMKYHGLSKQETLSKLVKQAEDIWKDLNTEWVVETSVPKDFLEQFLNYARATQVTYGRTEGFTNPANVLAPHIIALLGDPIVI